MSSFEFDLPTKVQASRLLLGRALPYFSAYNWALIPTPAPGLGTMAVDRWGRWYIDLEEVGGWSVGKIASGVLHEIFHLFARHSERMKDKPHDKANLAMDLAVNTTLKGIFEAANAAVQQHNQGGPKTATFAVEEDWLLPERIRPPLPEHLMAEEYYALLEARDWKGMEHLLDGDGDGEGCGGGEGGEGGEGDPSGKKKKGKGKGDGKGDGKGKPRPGRGRCGSCAGGHHPWEEKGPGDGGLSQPELDIMARHAAEAIQAHAKNRGTLPAGLDRYAAAYLEEPKVNWRRELAAQVRRSVNWVSGAVDFSYQKFSRRSTPDIFLPSLKKPQPNVVCVLDTSGSMSGDDVMEALSEFQGLLRHLGFSRVPMLVGDASFDDCQEVTNARQLKLTGGGGTDMALGFRKAKAHKSRPSVVIIFSDAESPFPGPEEVQDTKCIFVVIGSCRDIPPHIKAVFVDDKK